MNLLGHRLGVRVAIVGMVVAVFLPVAQATITDDINPQDRAVHVSLLNDGPAPDRGLVEVVVDLGSGKTATEVAPYDLAAGEKGTVTVEFEAEVVEVIAVAIIEDPDPVPVLR